MKRIAIANRGEVACRIHRACEQLSFESVLLHSEPDTQSIAYRQCHDQSLIGPGPSSESYLNIDRVLQAALAKNVDALHPGFGFLSENQEFAEACEKAGITFIGPNPKTLGLFGDKISAKDLCEKANVPTLPSYRGDCSKIDSLTQEAKKIGYPVLVKAAAGGGGRGMRIVHEPSQLNEAVASAKSEALKAFGSDTVFLEKYLSESKHIEVQIFGDKDGKIFVLGERECSVQRRHQKIIEEAPSPSLSPEQREQVWSYARKLGEEANYKSAGTVEFLFDGTNFYFLEVNTRLQVEHPVTEEIWGIDLVEAQIKTALGQPAGWQETDLNCQGHSIECRIYAEDLKGFPSTGRVGELSFETGPGIRLELGFERGDTITPFYDSMVAKFIATEKNRNRSIELTLKALSNSYVTGIYSNIPLLKEILSHSEFVSGTMTTKFFETHFGEGLASPYSEETLDHLFNTENETTKSIWNSNWRGA